MVDNINTFKELHFLFYNLKRNDVQANFGDNETFNCIFDHFDKLDSNADNSIDAKKLFGNVNSRLIYNFATFQKANNQPENNLSEMDKEYMAAMGVIEFEEGEFAIDDEKIAKYIDEHPDLKGVSTDDFKNFFNALIKTNTKISEEEDAKYKKQQYEKYPNIPKNIAEKLLLENNEQVKVINKNGKKYYEITDNEGNYRRLNSDGNVVAYKSEVTAMGESSEYFNTLGAAEEMLLFSDDGQEIGAQYKYGNGVTDYIDYQNNTTRRRMGKTTALYTGENNRLDSLSVNKGLMNETKLECSYDKDGNITDIKMTQKALAPLKNSDGLALEVDTPIKMSDEEKNNLKNLINGGAKFGEDFSLELDGNNKLTINPLIANESEEEMPPIPQNIKNEVLNLAKQGLRNNRDYTIKYKKDGTFEIDFNTAKGRNYASEDTKITYSKDGNTKTTTSITGDTIQTKVEKHGVKNAISQKRNDAFLERLLYGDFEGATKLFGDISNPGRDFNQYNLFKEYEKLTNHKIIDDVFKAYDNGKITPETIGKLLPSTSFYVTHKAFTTGEKRTEYEELARKAFEHQMKKIDEISNFDVSKSQIANLIPENKKEKISDTQYTETSNGATFKVTQGKDNITIAKDGKTYTLDLKGVNANIQKLLFNCDANIIYRLASQNTKVNIYSNTGKTGRNDDSVNGFYDPKENSINLNSETLSGKVMQRTIAHETGHSFQQYLTDDIVAVFKEERQNWQNSDEMNKNGDSAYCTTHIYEMVAESYALLTTGTAKSEYTLAKHFPKTFAMVKQMIEENSK